MTKGRYHINNELSQSSDKAEAYAEMVGNTPFLTHIHTTNKTGDAYNIFNGTDSFNFDLNIPLQFGSLSLARALPYGT